LQAIPNAADNLRLSAIAAGNLRKRPGQQPPGEQSGQQDSRHGQDGKTLADAHTSSSLQGSGRRIGFWAIPEAAKAARGSRCAPALTAVYHFYPCPASAPRAFCVELASILHRF